MVEDVAFPFSGQIEVGVLRQVDHRLFCRSWRSSRRRVRAFQIAFEVVVAQKLNSLVYVMVGELVKRRARS